MEGNNVLGDNGIIIPVENFINEDTCLMVLTARLLRTKYI